jgi:ERCC4-related helicase
VIDLLQTQILHDFDSGKTRVLIVNSLTEDLEIPVAEVVIRYVRS